MQVEVLEFWFVDCAGKWFSSNPAQDAQIKQRFEPLMIEAAAGELSGWRSTAEGCLALITSELLSRAC